MCEKDLSGSIQGYPVYGDYYAHAISSSKINMGLLQGAQGRASQGDSVTSRSFHIPASGGFLLHERTDEILEYYQEGMEIECFDNADEMVEKASYYLVHEDERRAIAHAGRERCVEEYSWQLNVKKILSEYEKCITKTG